MLGDVKADDGIVIAGAVAVEGFDAFAAETNLSAWLGSGRNTDFNTPFDSFDFGNYAPAFFTFLIIVLFYTVNMKAPINYRKETEKMAAAVAEKIVEITSQAGFNYWEDKEFRGMVDFESLTQTEQDRMFNELMVSALILAMMKLDEIVGNPDLARERKIVFSLVRDALPNGYLDTLRGFGIERKYIRIWKKLLDMRKKEYFEDLTLAKSETIAAAEFKDHPEFKEAWARIETIGICTLQHIRRGRTDPKDKLWRSLRFFLLSLEKNLSVLFNSMLKL